MKKWDLDSKVKIYSLPNDISQYEEINFEEGEIVDAIYRKTEIKDNQLKALIAALPPALSMNKIHYHFRKDIDSFNSYQKKLTVQEKKENVELLRNVRVPLPFSISLASEIHRCLINSYSKRYLSIKTIDECMHSSPFGYKQNSKVIGHSSESTDSCFSLTGYSGCGKSSAIKSVFSHYPQCIRHVNEWGEFVQVVYLVVNCYANGNLSQLFNGIGKAFDHALNLDNVYENLITRKRGIQEKTQIITNLIETFCVGIIILDEIQLMNFSANRSNSFETLMTMMNETKVAIGVVGTEDAREKMFGVLRTARRFQKDIRADLYCHDIKYFASVIHQLWHYQWYDSPVELTDEITIALCEETKCIIVQLINLLIEMHKDYLSAKKKPVINATFVHKTMGKHFSGIKPLLEQSSNFSNEKIVSTVKFKQINNLNIVHDVSDQLDSLNESHQMNINDLDKQRLLKEKVIYNIKKVSLQTESEIIYAFDKVISTLSEKDQIESKVTRLVNMYLLGFDFTGKRKEKLTSKDLEKILKI